MPTIPPRHHSKNAMSLREKRLAADHDSKRYLTLLGIYSRALSIVLMLFGLRQWAVIVGISASPGGIFEMMTPAWQVATMYLAVIDLVAAVGLWMRVAWGNVLWVCAAISEIVFHTFFMNTFGTDYLVVGFHLLAIGGFAALFLLARKEQESWPFGRN
jgi:uncharacterized membrane protein (DUF2068 family)